MAEVSLEVPGELVGPLRESVLLLYASSAEALHLALREHRAGRVGQEEVRRHRARLARLDALLDQLGGSACEPGRDVEVSASRELVHDAVYGALIEAGERLAAACDAGWRGERPFESVAALARSVIALDGLLRQLRE
jgi:hypothetical protein